MWILRTVGQPTETTFRLLPSSTKTIGRATGADFILDESLISRVHCRVEVNISGDLDITDLGSTNGTFVNGNRITAARLVPGDRFTVGRVELIALKDQD
jgi:pSer/pThr/pTyr-binding forkhead associated (FHA) protein